MAKRHVDVAASIEAAEEMHNQLQQESALPPVPEALPDVDKPPMRRLRLKRAYRGWRTHEQVILAGEYDEDNPALLNLADFLVDSDHAEWIAVG